jgi:adenylate cyclase
MTHDADQRSAEGERRARLFLSGEYTGGRLRFGRRFLALLPSSPRCKLCASPFKAPLGPVMRLVGKGPWPKNPKYCSACFSQLVRYHVGAEVQCSLLFADVRGSTPLAETMRPAAFTGLMNRFFETAARVLVSNEAIVDKFVGDEVIGIFVPALAGGAHAARAIKAGRELLLATGHADAEPWLPIGVGVNTGVAYVGAVGEGEHVELTAMGDPVNVTARLASAAGTGELFVTLDAAHAAGLEITSVEHRTLDLKGKSEAMEVVILHAQV